MLSIEVPGGDPSKAKIYPITTLFGDGKDLTPVTLTFKDVNGDGKLDMEIHIQDQTLVMINENGGIIPPKPGEKRKPLRNKKKKGVYKAEENATKLTGDLEDNFRGGDQRE